MQTSKQQEIEKTPISTKFDTVTQFRRRADAK